MNDSAVSVPTRYANVVGGVRKQDRIRATVHVPLVDPTRRTYLHVTHVSSIVRDFGIDSCSVLGRQWFRNSQPDLYSIADDRSLCLYYVSFAVFRCELGKKKYHFAILN